MTGYTETGTILDKILAHKVEEVAARKIERSQADVRAGAEAAPPINNFADALRGDHVALIAEIKKASPSKGLLVENFDPANLAKVYAANGASAVSVLTDERFFMGGLDDLHAVRRTVNLPILRKDFIIDPYQLWEARAAGASAVLLIAAALDDAQLRDLYTLANESGMHALVEVHNESELDCVLPTIEPILIGVNNRDLKTFTVDLSVSERLARLMPDGVIMVAESGISTREDVMHMAEAGADAILVGESLVRAGNTDAKVRALSSIPRKGRDA